MTQQVIEYSEYRHDPYFDACSSVRDPGFRETLKAYYPHCIDGDRVRCQVSGVVGNSQQVIAAHLIPCKSPDILFTEVGLLPRQINEGINGLLLALNIERAFDHKQVCFVQHPLHMDTIVMKVLDMEEMSKRPLFDGTSNYGRTYPPSDVMISTLHNHKLDFNENLNLICKRTLSRHSFFAYREARKRNWITGDSTGSEGIIVPNDYGI
mmetsp:Transcript_30515/g.41776  ORF Transcript_30515/g.41776 Transcript_30515/m.41776 type:complete len:209 (+) Transcript_30515:135-761(+)